MWVLVIEHVASGGAASALTAEPSFLPDSQLFIVVVLLPTFLWRNNGDVGMEKKRTRIPKENLKNL